MKTSSFRSYTGPGRISIARYARGAAAGFRVYRKLAPGDWFNKVTPDEYCRRYAAILEGLDPKQTYFELGYLVAPEEPVLLCWEKPPLSYPSNWCHRRMASCWMERTLRITIPEIGSPRTDCEFPPVFQDWLDRLS